MTKKEYDIEEAFAIIEEELLDSLKKRLERGLEDDDFKVWQAEQLSALQQYRYIDDEHFKKRFSKLNKEITALLEEVGDSAKEKEVKSVLNRLKGDDKGVASDEIMLINKNKMDAFISDTVKDFEKAEYATLRRVDDAYRTIIFNAETYFTTGSGTLRQAIDMATHDFYSNGIDSVEYKNGARVNITSYSEMALRTANKRATLQGAAAARDEYDLHLVIINRRGTACSKCARFRGRVCIDDVFGNGKPDGKHALLSTFMKGGLYHPNCKDSHSTYYEGVSEPPSAPTKAEQEEAERIYALEQKQRYNERQIRKYKRLEREQLDEENIAKAKAKRIEWQRRQKEFVDSHDELRRKYDREQIY